MRLPGTIFVFAAAIALSSSPLWAESSHAPTPHGKAPTTPVSSQSSHASTPHGKAPTTTTNTSTTTSGTSTTTTTTTPKLNPIAAKISSHPQLLAKVTALLPDGVSLNDATKGFSNQGQAIAALHVAHNLHLSFTDLQKDMTKKGMSLGRAIQDVKHTSSTTATHEVEKAETETDDDLKSTK